jgi:hypothetical protein
MIMQLSKMTPILFAGAAAAAIAAAPIASAEPPPPPPCLNWDGTPCASTGNITDDGAVVNVPNGPGGTADWGGATGSLAPNGPGGSAGPGGASGCLPNIGCINIPAP